MVISLIAATALAVAPRSSFPVINGKIMDEHRVFFKDGPTKPSHYPSGVWLLFDVSEKTCWQFRGSKPIYACKYSPAAKTHRNLHGWHRIVVVYRDGKDWSPTDSAYEMARKHHQPRPQPTKRSDSHNPFGAYCLQLDVPRFLIHGNANHPETIGVVGTLGCPQTGNGDGRQMIKNGICCGTSVYLRE